MLEWMPWAVAIAIGFITLNQGAKFITDNATRISGRIGANRFVVGALLVSTLSALPELLVSGIAAQEGSPEIALGIALVALFVPYVLNLSVSQRTGPPDEIQERVDDLTIGLEFTGWIFGRKVEIRAGIGWLILGVLWSVMGAQFLVFGAIGVSAVAGLNPWFMGITVVALGTSLPDIAAAYHATRRGYTDLVLGEGIGASVVTTLLTLGMIGLLRPSTHSVELLLPVVGAMVLTSFLLLALMLGEWKITSRSGAVLTSSYFAMVAFNLVWFRGGFT